jgi:hypothetical protein
MILIRFMKRGEPSDLQNHLPYIRNGSSVYYYGSEVRKMLNRGMAITAVDYINAHRPREKIKYSFLKTNSGYDGYASSY